MDTVTAVVLLGIIIGIAACVFVAVVGTAIFIGSWVYDKFFTWRKYL